MARPSGQGIVRNLGESYLSEAMQDHLDGHAASFDFCVQLQKPGMPIEDAGQRWDEAKSPFLKVATLQLPVQKSRNSKRARQAEALSFSPAHALPAHAPLGGLNRARSKIDAALSRFRHKRDKRAECARGSKCALTSSVRQLRVGASGHWQRVTTSPASAEPLVPNGQKIDPAQVGGDRWG